MTTATPSLPRVSSIAEKSGSLLGRPLSLRERDTQSFDLAENENYHVSIRTGTAWVTMEDNPDDLALTANTPRAEFTGPGRLVIEAIGGGLAFQVARTKPAN